MATELFTRTRPISGKGQSYRIKNVSLGGIDENSEQILHNAEVDDKVMEMSSIGPGKVQEQLNKNTIGHILQSPVRCHYLMVIFGQMIFRFVLIYTLFEI